MYLSFFFLLVIVTRALTQETGVDDRFLVRLSQCAPFTM